MSSSTPIERSGRLWSETPVHSADYRPAEPQRAPYWELKNMAGFSDSPMEPDFISFMGACSVPPIGLPKTGTAYRESDAIELGSGLTSRVVQYTTTDNQLARIIGCGRVVALKIFARKKTSTVASQTAYGNIIREMKILSHPLLAGHPNIVQLHFVGFRKGEQFPVLGMEHASHGSLEYFIRNPWYGLTDVEFQQIRRHITIDIALGLHAVHKAGFAHGDLKPDNILIMSHPGESRRVIVKLTDFGGSSLNPDQDSGRPLHYTPLWCAPEVINQDPDIDWRRADVYSYGLIIGSLWASNPIGDGFGAGRLEEPSSSFLADFVISNMSKEEEMDIFWVLKSEADDMSPNSINFILRKRLVVTIQDEIDRVDVLQVLEPTLKAYYWLRPCTEGLCQGLQALAVRAGRRIWEETDVCSGSRAKGTAKELIGELGSKGKYKELFDFYFEQRDIALKNRAAQPWDLVTHEDLPDTLPENIDPWEYCRNIASILQHLSTRAHLGESHERATRFTERRFAVPIAWAASARSIFVVDWEQYIDVTNYAAMVGSFEGIWFASLFLYNTDKKILFPIRCYLALLALSQSCHAAQILHDYWPTHYNAVQQMMRLKPSAFEKSSHLLIDPAPFMLNILGNYDNEPILHKPLSLRQVLNMGIVKDLWAVLEGDAAPSDLGEHAAELLHGLSNFPDSEAAAMAPKAYQKGGKLSFIGISGPFLPARGEFEHESFVPNKLSPLSAAIRSGKFQLARAILCLHIERNEAIVDFYQAITLSCLYLENDITDLLLNHYHDSPDMCPQDSGTEHCSEPLSSRILIETFMADLPDFVGLERRLLHGDRLSIAYKNTLEILLRHGANPIGGSILSLPLLTALRNDDLIALNLFIQNLKERNVDVASLLGGQRMPRQDTVSNYTSFPALSLCILCSSIRCFGHILQEFPHLALKLTSHPLGWTILHLACSRDDGTPFVEALLQCGADVAATDTRGQTPICIGLLERNLGIANAISCHCTPEELHGLLAMEGESGRSVFAELLVRWPHNRSLDTLEIFRWLSRNGGIHQLAQSGVPAWHEVVKFLRPFSRVDQRLDLELVKLILGSDRPIVGVPNCPQFHSNILVDSATNGHVEVVKFLLENGFDPNSSVDAPESIVPPQFKSDPRMKKFNALDMVYAGLSGTSMPVPIARAGFIEVQRYLDDLEKIRRLLISKGVRGMMHDQIEEDTTPSKEEIDNFKFLRNVIVKRGIAMTGSWPKPFVELATSLEPNSEQEMVLNFMRSNLQMKRKHTLRESESKEIPEGYTKTIKSQAMIKKHGWRLPPHWRCVARVDHAGRPGGYTAVYVNGVSKEITLERPALFKGEPQANIGKGKEKAIEGDIYGATPLLGPQAQSPEPDISVFDLGGTDLPNSRPPIMPHSEVKPRIEQPQNAEDADNIQTETGEWEKPILLELLKIEDFYPLCNLLHLRCQDGTTMLHISAASDNLEFLSFILDKELIPINGESHSGLTPLHIATINEKTDALALLLAYGADPNRIFPSNGYRPIHYSVGMGCADITNVLIQGGADVNATAPGCGGTPLHFCVAKGDNTECLEILLGNGANINATGPNVNATGPGGSALMLAVAVGGESNVVMLLNAGACPAEDENLLHIAARGESTKIMEALLDKGLDINKRPDFKKVTPLIEAVKCQRAEILRLLLERGADISVLEEFQFFVRPHDDGTIDRLAIPVIQELNDRIRYSDHDGWEEWEPITITKVPESVQDIYCGNCGRSVTDAHFHYSICNAINFDLCQECVDRGINYPSDGYWLTKRTV
ncbi:hypothetical protein ANO14919_040490 [Xylariales sp. No.14919]|nr:hypothetical protein ANO14919_040490 [Xylariales sp. No.14919]